MISAAMKLRTDTVILCCGAFYLLTAIASLVLIVQQANGAAKSSQLMPIRTNAPVVPKPPLPPQIMEIPFVPSVAKKPMFTPPQIVVVPKPAFFAVTAYDKAGMESDFSPELGVSITGNTVSLAWDEADINATGYRLYWGANSRSYGWTKDVGNTKTFTLTQVFPVAPAIPIYFAVYGQSSTNPVGPFFDISGTPISRFTNGAGDPRNFYRLREFSSTNAIP